MQPRRLSRFCLQAALLSAVLFAIPLAGQEFRVVTEVFVEGKTEPVLESLTLFSGDVVYDFLLSGSSETTIFDVRRGRLVLLDPKRQIKTSLTTGELTELSAAIRTLGLQQGALDLFQPKFEINYEDETKRLTMSSDRLTYRAKAVEAKHVEGAQRFRQFADWYARLNAIRPGNVPPFGRLELNQALAERGLLPVEIERTLVLDRVLADKTSHATSKHVITWILSNTDRGRIDQAGRDLVKFAEVSPSAYWADTTATTKSP